MTDALKAQICGWARHYLVNDFNAVAPTNEQLTFYVEPAVRTLTTGRPALVLEGVNVLNADDLAIFAQAAGAQVAAAVGPTPLGAYIGRGMVRPAREIKIGEVTRKIAATATGTPPAQRVAAYEAEVLKLLGQISVLRVPKPTATLFALAGRRRSLGG